MEFRAVAENISLLCMPHGTFLDHGLIDIGSSKPRQLTDTICSPEPLRKVVFLERRIGLVPNDSFRRRLQFSAYEYDAKTISESFNA